MPSREGQVDREPHATKPQTPDAVGVLRRAFRPRPQIQFLVGPEGFEPTTNGLKVTGWGAK